MLNEFGFGSLNFKIEDFLETNNIIQLGYEPTRIDILTSISGVEFDNCYQKAVEANFEGLEIKFIDLKNLRINKASSGRPKDLGDLENLIG